MSRKKTTPADTPDLFAQGGADSSDTPLTPSASPRTQADTDDRLPAAPMGLTFDGESLTLADFAERAYLDYAVSVVKGRALPDLCDGMKPVVAR